MTLRRAAIRTAPLAWLVVAVLSTAVFTALSVAGPHLVTEHGFVVAPSNVVIAPVGLAFAVVGTIVARRLPAHPVGWLLGAFGTIFAFGRAVEVYAAQGLVAGAARPGAALLNWAVVYGWALGQLALAMALLHFPTGRLPSPRWFPLRVLAAVLVPVLIVLTLLLWPVRAEPSLLSTAQAFPATADALASVVELPVLLTTLLAAASVVIRYRAADTIGRLQLRWLFAATVFVAVGFALLLATGGNPNGEASPAALLLLGVGLTAIPASIAVAVLRYRLWDLDRLVSRGATYVVVSVVLLAIYLAAVVGSQALLEPVTGEGDLPVALATLAAAAAARPVLVRVQRMVDRRFNRARYDAVRTIENFGRDLRDEMRPNAVIDDLRHVVAATLQPHHVDVLVTRDGGAA